MFDKKDVLTIDIGAFDILNADAYRIELRSRMSGHYWHITSEMAGNACHCVLHHKYEQLDSYHWQRECANLHAAQEYIKHHDLNVLRRQNGGVIFGYARVSTKGQARDGNGLEAQEEVLKIAGVDIIYKEYCTGTSMSRPKLEKLLQELRSGDTLVVTKLDRIGRSVSGASQLITDLLTKGIKVNVLNIGLLSNDSTSQLLMNVLLAFAQFERDMIVERTQEGREVKRRTDPDYKEGRKPKYTQAQRNHWMELLQNHTYSEVATMTGASKSTIIREANNRGFSRKQKGI